MGTPGKPRTRPRSPGEQAARQAWADAGAPLPADGLPARKPLSRKRHGPASGVPANGTWPPFAEGNTLAQTHGAGDLDRRNGWVTNAVVGLENEILGHLDELFLGDVPAQLTMPVYRFEVESWARLQSKTLLYWRWLQGMDEEEQSAPRNGGQKSPIEIWMALEAQAAKARDRLGLNPKSWGIVRATLGITDLEKADALERLSQQGAEIRKTWKVIEGTAEG